MKRNRKRILKINHELLIELLSGKSKITNLPDDCEMVTCNFDFYNNCILVLVISEEFDIVEPGMMCPDFIGIGKAVSGDI